MKEFISKFKEKWSTLPAEAKKKMIIGGVCLAVIVISLLGYVATRSGGQKTTASSSKNQEQIKEITLDKGVLEKTQITEAQQRYAEMQKQIEEIKKLQEEKDKEIETLKKEKAEQAAKSPQPPLPPVPPVPPPPTQQGAPSKIPGMQGQGIPGGVPPAGKLPEPPKEEVIGGIGIVSQTIEKKTDTSKDTKKKTYYLPTSFMEATLLSGLDAPAISKGEGNPVPTLFRIKAPAVLPNSVKTNLRGCFVIAEGLGSLSDERVHLRLVTISCIDRKGNAVIDQKIKGFVVDNDGKIGLRGRVVSKMGSLLARSLIAGFFGGLGNIAGVTAYDYSTSGDGTVSTLKSGDVAQAALGGAVQQASNELQKFYLELARQTIPVIEVQATRTVTLVVSEGVELEIKEYDLNRMQ